MADSSLMRTIDVEKMVSYSEDLVACLKRDQNRDVDMLAENLGQSKLHVSQSQADYNYDLKLLQEYLEKIVLSKQKAEEAKSEVAASAELNFLQKELEEELQKERLLREELRVIIDEINDLERQRLSVEEQRQIVKKLKQDEQKAEMKLAMYASVTKIIPNLDEDSKISGCIMDKEREALEYFERDPSEDTPFDMCNSIWEKISPRFLTIRVRLLARFGGAFSVDLKVDARFLVRSYRVDIRVSYCVGFHLRFDVM